MKNDLIRHNVEKALDVFLSSLAPSVAQRTDLLRIGIEQEYTAVDTLREAINSIAWAVVDDADTANNLADSIMQLIEQERRAVAEVMRDRCVNLVQSWDRGERSWNEIAWQMPLLPLDREKE